MIDVIQFGAIIFLGVMLFLLACAYAALHQSHETLHKSVRELRRQNVRDKLDAPPTRPILRNRELMKVGDMIADGSMSNVVKDD